MDDKHIFFLDKKAQQCVYFVTKLKAKLPQGILRIIHAQYI